MLWKSKLSQELPGASEATTVLTDVDFAVSWLTSELESSKKSVWLDPAVDATRFVAIDSSLSLPLEKYSLHYIGSWRIDKQRRPML